MKSRNEAIETANLQLARARSFERAAYRVIEFNPPRQRALHAPTLHLIAHGFELAMKAVLSFEGVSVSDQRNLGHHLNKLWKKDELSDFRDHAKLYSEDCCYEARESGKYEENSFPENPYEEFTEHLCLLSRLHSQESDYALRYPTQSPCKVSYPDSLRCVLDKLINYLASKFGANDTSRI